MDRPPRISAPPRAKAPAIGALVTGGGRRRHAVAARGVAWALLALAGCTGGGGPEDHASGEATASTPGEPARFRGVLTVLGRAEIVLCDGRSLALDGPAAMELLELHAELTPGGEPLEGMFVDVLAELRDAEEAPWLNALEVRRAAIEGWGCGRDEAALVLEASGTEPFWSLTVEERTATWRTPESLEALVHDGPYPMPRGGSVLEGRGQNGAVRLRAEFYQGPCRNAMSGAYSHLTAVVTLDGVGFRGCAFSGPEAASPL